MSKSKCTKHTMFGALLEVAMSKKCTPLWREEQFQAKMYKSHQLQTTFGSCNAEKVHAVVVRSICRSQNAQNTPCSEHIWKLRCGKSARRCGAKNSSKMFQAKMYKTHQLRTTFGSCNAEKVHPVVVRSTFRSQNAKHTMFGAHLEVALWKKCTPLWREEQFQDVPSQNVQNTPAPDYFWKLLCRKSGPRCGAKHRSQNVQSTPASDYFWKLQCRKSVHYCGAKHISNSKCQSTTCSRHFWTFRCRFAWQAQGIAHLVKSEQNVRVLWHFQKRWQAWDI